MRKKINAFIFFLRKVSASFFFFFFHLKKQISVVLATREKINSFYFFQDNKEHISLCYNRFYIKKYA